MTIIETGSPVLELFPELLLISPLFLSNLTTRSCPSVIGIVGHLNSLVYNFIPVGIPEFASLYVIINLLWNQFEIR